MVDDSHPVAGMRQLLRGRHASLTWALILCGTGWGLVNFGFLVFGVTDYSGRLTTAHYGPDQMRSAMIRRHCVCRAPSRDSAASIRSRHPKSRPCSPRRARRNAAAASGAARQSCCCSASDLVSFPPVLRQRRSIV